MAILPLVTAPDPLLKQRSEPVAEVDDDVRALLEDMLETMYANDGIGLAAVQVGVLKRIVVMDVARRDGGRQPIRLVNPEIVTASEEMRCHQEGCLSFPGQYSDVERPDRVSVRYLDEHGQEQRLEADGLLATCVQHEIDHTDGITFVDHISRLKRNMILNRLRKQKVGAL